MVELICAKPTGKIAVILLAWEVLDIFFLQVSVMETVTNLFVQIR